jgi:hypothetical protein
MAKCPFAAWKELSGSSGAFVGGGPIKIVHHTTEYHSAQVAMDAFKANALTRTPSVGIRPTEPGACSVAVLLQRGNCSPHCGKGAAASG